MSLEQLPCSVMGCILGFLRPWEQGRMRVVSLAVRARVDSSLSALYPDTLRAEEGRLLEGLEALERPGLQPEEAVGLPLPALTEPKKFRQEDLPLALHPVL
jgi:hypothetical protein